MKKDIVIPVVMALITVALEKIIPESYINGKMTIYFKDVIPYVLFIGLAIYFSYLRHRDNKIAKMRIKFFKKYGNGGVEIKEFQDLYTTDELKMLGFKVSEIRQIKSSGFGITLGEVLRDAHIIMEGE